MAKTDLTAARLRELLHYDQDTGVFTRLVKTCNSLPINHPVGSIDRHGYYRTKIEYKTYSLHRLAWLYVYGSFPANHIDHINGMKTDNRICNLRNVTQAENIQNQREAQKGTRSGLLGAYWNHGKWRAVIQMNGVVHNLGNFSTAEEAHAAYVVAKRMLHATCTI